MTRGNWPVLYRFGSPESHFQLPHFLLGKLSMENHCSVISFRMGAGEHTAMTFADSIYETAPGEMSALMERALGLLKVGNGKESREASYHRGICQDPKLLACIFA